MCGGSWVEDREFFHRKEEARGHWQGSAREREAPILGMHLSCWGPCTSALPCHSLTSLNPLNRQQRRGGGLEVGAGGADGPPSRPRPLPLHILLLPAQLGAGATLGLRKPLSLSTCKQRLEACICIHACVYAKCVCVCVCVCLGNFRKIEN